ncbi:hypothetical protein L1606_03430 [Streptomyces spororaveus]|uniref:hypothetical protein n=1 Tax=Streptomyces spororaveus TaxID=284039 RepID=UPI002079394C|nr:hypothetical protein [Streptomyces spororaveus]MCM9077156.1 hypothetical protein [Streptomyces spororaveus]
MYIGGEPVGDLHPHGFDQPWIICKFVPLPGWNSELEGLFEAQNETAKNRFPADQMGPVKEIRDRGVELHPLLAEDEAIISPLILYIENGEARFR